MNRMNIFQVLRSGRFAALVALVGLGFLFTASGVKAGGCSVMPYKAGAAVSAPYKAGAGAGPASPSPSQQEGEENEPASIVGLWHLIYTQDGGGQFAETLKTWHADGTEWEEAFFSPGASCYGVWKDLGHGSVKLHHIGLMFSAVGVLTNIFTVDEIDTVARGGQTYSGTFDFKLWGPTFSDVGNGAPLTEVKGTTAGTRITVD
jgi:hypothetical protein